jgi:hypothetical protein
LRGSHLKAASFLSFAREVDMKVLHAGSAAVALTLSAACATHTTASPDPVKVTTSAADVAGCSAVGKVTVSDTDPDPARNASNQAAAIGGNVLLRDNALVYNGSAYHCPAAAAH